MTTLNNASQWEFDAPKFYDFTKQENPNEQVESWFGKKGQTTQVDDQQADYYYGR